MSGKTWEDPKIAIVGLGYVGLPLAVAMARHHDVLGFDILTRRIDELRAGHDSTGEVDTERLRASTLRYSHDTGDLDGRNVFIVTVPTPVGPDNLPDLGAVRAASRTVAKAMKPGAIVVYESTVYPGVTEDVCGPILEQESGLTCGRDFFLGYSPERINPGDKLHTVDKIAKIVSGQTPEVAAVLAELYGGINGGNIFVARDIRTAEAAKVIENAQRDINIAFMNEIANIFGRMGLSTYDVLDAARTKWNFLPFTPGLVGGHCIGVDPFYLAHAAKAIGVEPEVILSGRRVNDSMAGLIAGRIAEMLPPAARILVLGVTFKENVPDIRNSKVFDLIAALRQRGFTVAAHDPHADRAETLHEYGEDLTDAIAGPWECVVLAVAHADLAGMDASTLTRPGGLVADIKGAWRDREMPARTYWTL